MGPELPHALEAIRSSTDYFLKATAIPGVRFCSVSEKAPGSEVSAEIGGGFHGVQSFWDRGYAKFLYQRASKVFEFADKYRGSNNDSIGHWACPFYCDYSGYWDELLWAAAWLHKATKSPVYWNYVLHNIKNFKPYIEFVMSELLVSMCLFPSLEASTPFLSYANNFVCNVMPESPTNNVRFSPIHMD
ncbi:Endoglucanase 8 [Abeliophyllum distichum]|uniref:cellulase n=1 Tax=Abeliophyllum distichum TaxID=126358 RepID=A0ABD1W0E9_9LAMI